jgi:phenylacetic acid degradation operon negative regulatory protein
LTVVRGRRQGGSDRQLVERVWSLDELATGYREFLARYRPLARRSRWDDQDAFRLRFAVVLDFLEVAWRDPELPPALAPHRWPGARARQLAADLYHRFLPGAIRFGDAIAASVPVADSAARARVRG